MDKGSIHPALGYPTPTGLASSRQQQPTPPGQAGQPRPLQKAPRGKARRLAAHAGHKMSRINALAQSSERWHTFVRSIPPDGATYPSAPLGTDRRWRGKGAGTGPLGLLGYTEMNGSLTLWPAVEVLDNAQT